jgi:superfamily II RNA helicase
MVLNEVTIIAKRLIKTQRDYDIDIPVHFARHFAPFIEMWANGATWKQIQLASPFDDGDIVRAIRRTLDLARQFARVKGLRPELAARLEDVERAINRDEVLEDV